MESFSEACDKSTADLGNPKLEYASSDTIMHIYATSLIMGRSNIYTMSQLNKILVVCPAWIGDMMMTQVLFKLIKIANPLAEIDVLIPSWCAPLAAYMPEINTIIPAPFKHGKLHLIARYHLAKKLQNRNYQQAILIPNSFKSALIPFFAKIPLRTGWLGEKRYGLLNDYRKLDKAHYPLWVKRVAKLAAPKESPLPKNLPEPSLLVSKTQIMKTLNALQINQPTNKVLALCPGASFGPAKRWPAQYYSDIAKTLLKQGWDIWLFGSKDDNTITTQIANACNNQCINLAGKTTLAEAIDLLALANVVVTNDSGLMHIAAALDKPLIAIYGASNSKHTPPLNEQHQILQLNLACQPCMKRVCPLKHHDCMKKLKPEQVIFALHDMIGRFKLA